MDVLERLNKSLKSAATSLTREEVRFLVKMYYLTQEHRKQYASQARTSEEVGEPNALNLWFFDNVRFLESDLKKVMDNFSSSYKITNWLRSIVGIGPVISSGLVANFDITIAKTAGQFERICGLDPTRKWYSKAEAEKMAKLSIEEISEIMNVHPSYFNGITKIASRISKRPWNSGLKSLVIYKLGESFVKSKNKEGSFYGPLYDKYKKEITEKNEAKEYADQAEVYIKKIGKDKEAYKFYKEGTLPPAHVHARARRKTVKIFISHLHHTMYLDYYGTPPPIPYIFTKSTHRHFIEPPSFGGFEGRPLTDMYKS